MGADATVRRRRTVAGANAPRHTELTWLAGRIATRLAAIHGRLPADRVGPHPSIEGNVYRASIAPRGIDGETGSVDHGLPLEAHADVAHPADANVPVGSRAGATDCTGLEYKGKVGARTVAGAFSVGPYITMPADVAASTVADRFSVEPSVAMDAVVATGHEENQRGCHSDTKVRFHPSMLSRVDGQSQQDVDFPVPTAKRPKCREARSDMDPSGRRHRILWPPRPRYEGPPHVEGAAHDGETAKACGPGQPARAAVLRTCCAYACVGSQPSLCRAGQ